MKTQLKVLDYTLPIIHTMDRLFEHHGQDAQLEFRVVVSNKAGMCISDFRDFENEGFTKNPSRVLNYYKKGVLQTVECRVKGSDYWVSIFKRKGKKITLVDAQLLRDLKVGTVNSFWFNTNLYSWEQYKHTNTKTWDSYVFVENKRPEEQLKEA
jgi:hypothetical protein